MAEINHAEILQKWISGEDTAVKNMLEKVAEGLYLYERFTVKGVKSCCTKCRTRLQAAKRAADVIRKNVLNLKKKQNGTLETTEEVVEETIEENETAELPVSDKIE